MQWILAVNRQSPYLSALDFCNSSVWNIKFDELDFFLSLNWIFYVCCSLQTSSLKLNKNPVHQTGYFKLENCKNQVQIDRGSGFPYLTSIITDRIWLSLHQESNFSKNAVGDMLVLCCWHIAKFCAFGKGPFRKSSSMYILPILLLQSCAK